MVVLPGHELVWAVAHWVLTELLRVLERGFGQRHVGVAAGLDRECRVGLAELDIDGVVVNDGQAAQRGLGVHVRLLQSIIAFDCAEEAGAGLLVGTVGGVIPCVYEGVRGHRSAVGELPSALELDDVMRGVVAGGDAVCYLVVDAALRIVGHQTCEQLVYNLAATGLSGVAGE